MGIDIYLCTWAIRPKAHTKHIYITHFNDYRRFSHTKNAYPSQKKTTHRHKKKIPTPKMNAIENDPIAECFIVVVTGCLYIDFDSTINNYQNVWPHRIFHRRSIRKYIVKQICQQAAVFDGLKDPHNYWDDDDKCKNAFKSKCLFNM